MGTLPEVCCDKYMPNEQSCSLNRDVPTDCIHGCSAYEPGAFERNPGTWELIRLTLNRAKPGSRNNAREEVEV